MEGNPWEHPRPAGWSSEHPAMVEPEDFYTPTQPAHSVILGKQNLIKEHLFTRRFPPPGAICVQAAPKGLWLPLHHPRAGMGGDE